MGKKSIVIQTDKVEDNVLHQYASYNYLLVNGQRRLTEREMLRLQGFPENHKIIGSYSDLRKQAGNALPIPMAYRVISELIQKNYIGSTFANPKFEAGVSSQTTL